MQAIVIREWGGPEVLRLENTPDPRATDNDEIVELRACSVNYHDVLVRRGGRGLPLPRIPGVDGAGVVRGTGEEVVILPSLNWGDDDDVPSERFQVVGDFTDGTYAELIRIPKENLFPKPQHLSWVEAAAVPVAGLTAYRALFTKGSLEPGKTVLILGAGSGVSMMALLLANAVGAQAFVTSSSTTKIQRSTELGAVGGVLYTEDSWPEAAVDLMGGGADVVLDSSGSSAGQALACLRPGGKVVVLGARSGAATSISIPDLYYPQKSLVGTIIGHDREFLAMLELMDEHRIVPAVDHVWSLPDAKTAHETMESSTHFGKLCLETG